MTMPGAKMPEGVGIFLARFDHAPYVLSGNCEIERARPNGTHNIRQRFHLPYTGTLFL